MPARATNKKRVTVKGVGWRKPVSIAAENQDGSAFAQGQVNGRLQRTALRAAAEPVRWQQEKPSCRFRT
jgi:hypothetical protein